MFRIDSVSRIKNSNQQNIQAVRKEKEAFSEEENITPELSDNEIVNNNNINANNNNNNINAGKKKEESRPSINVDDNLINKGEEYMLKRAVNKKLANYIKSSNHDAKPNTSLRYLTFN